MWGGGMWEMAYHGFYMIFFSIVGKFAERLMEVAEWYYDRARDRWRPRIEITVPNVGNEWYGYNPLFTAVDTYLCSTASKDVRRLQAEADDRRNLTYGMDKGEHLFDAFGGEDGHFAVRWDYYTRRITSSSGGEIERRYYKLSFAPQHRTEVIGRYLKHVMETSQAIETKQCPKKLYSNSMGGEHQLWKSVAFKHPGTFDNLAMDSKKKQAILDDLTAFSKSKDYYASIGKAWKRGYLLHGPPGTGKSTMVAAIANFLDYDVYDLELTAVSSNGELRQLMIATKSRSVIVIEDIDCSLDLSGDRGAKEITKTEMDSDDEDAEDDSDYSTEKARKKNKKKVTLSGLLNSIDGLWSVCGGERVIVFTTNHPEKLDAALLRRGRMDMHIELSYCGFEAFKVLAKNYLGLDEHPLFAEVRGLLEETQITPADVAEHLMPKIAPLASSMESEQQQIQVKNLPPQVKRECLKDLIRALQEGKTKAQAGEGEEQIRKWPKLSWPRRRRKNPVKIDT